MQMQLFEEEGREKATKKPSKAKLLSIPVDKTYLQEIVLEYFSEQGYYHAYTALEKESELPTLPLPLLKEREEIRKLMDAGRVVQAIEKVSSVSPFIFSDFPGLLFAMVEQDILEDAYIKNVLSLETLRRIEIELSPIAEKHPTLLASLEETVKLAVFKSIDPERVQQRRREVFEQINQQILLLLDFEVKNTLRGFVSKVDGLPSSPAYASICKECPLFEKLMKKVTR
ncbi:hypothetical protein NEDG_02013 [Nematocida displodere]|uniref:Uncharacterized protein n=1 Tax=Nematocida displodere TaxID=1805483 RepID=A0A177EG52_9MICR|nr:hypothetical protein NEDG_02013 [Nematocida displodere]